MAAGGRGSNLKAKNVHLPDQHNGSKVSPFISHPRLHTDHRTASPPHFPRYSKFIQVNVARYEGTLLHVALQYAGIFTLDCFEEAW